MGAPSTQSANLSRVFQFWIFCDIVKKSFISSLHLSSPLPYSFEHFLFQAGGQAAWLLLSFSPFPVLKECPVQTRRDQFSRNLSGKSTQPIPTKLVSMLMLDAASHGSFATEFRKLTEMENSRTRSSWLGEEKKCAESSSPHLFAHLPQSSLNRIDPCLSLGFQCNKACIHVNAWCRIPWELCNKVPKIDGDGKQLHEKFLTLRGKEIVRKVLLLHLFARLPLPQKLIWIPCLFLCSEEQ